MPESKLSSGSAPRLTRFPPPPTQLLEKNKNLPSPLPSVLVTPATPILPLSVSVDHIAEMENHTTYKDSFVAIHGTEEEFQQKRIAKNLADVRKQIDSITTEVEASKTESGEDDNTVIEALQAVAEALYSKIEKVEKMNKEEAQESLLPIKKLSSRIQRIQKICTDLVNHRNEDSTLPIAINEILSKIEEEEKIYTSHLTCLQRFFRASISKIISVREDIVLFSTLEELLTLHKHLLGDIQFMRKQYPHATLGSLLQFYAPLFSCYLKYIENSGDALELFDQLLKQNKEFKQEIKLAEKTNSLHFRTLLEEPLKKLDHYMLHCERALDAISPKSAERHLIEDAFDQLQVLRDKSSKKANIAEQLMQLQTIGEELDGYDTSLVVPDRLLVCEGALRCMPEDSAEKAGDYVFLFTDILIYAQKKGTRKFQFCGEIGMHMVTVETDPSPNGFRMIAKVSPTAKAKEFLFLSDNAPLSQDWFIHFSNAQRDVMRYRKIFGVPLKTITKRENSIVPQFVEKSINFIRKYGLESEGIFRLSGRASQITKLRNQLDQGKKVFFSENMDVHSVANLFKQWLREMPEPILTWALYDEFILASEMEVEQEKLSVLYKLLNERLPVVNRKSFQVMMKLLTEVIANEEITKLNATTLGVVFAPNVLVDGDPNANPFTAKFAAVNDVFTVMLSNYDFLFKDIEVQNDSDAPDADTRAEATSQILPAQLRPVSKNKRDRNSKDLGRIFGTPTRAAVPGKEDVKNSKCKGVLAVFEKNSWNHRFFSVTQGNFYKYRGTNETDKKTKICSISAIIQVSEDDALGKPFVFRVEKKKESFILAANSLEEQREWMQALGSP